MFLSPDELTVIKYKKKLFIMLQTDGGALPPSHKKSRGASAPPGPLLQPPMNRLCCSKMQKNIGFFAFYCNVLAWYETFITQYRGQLGYPGAYLVNKPLPAAGISADNVRG